eukprot:Hpha_TRINITY_DN20320_c0_g1::TRINITY_DN20320_c0_g1_i1::g.138123::m.138123
MSAARRVRTLEAHVNPEPPSCVDTGRYPLHTPEGFRSVLTSVRERVVREGCCVLPGFVLPAAVSQMKGEALTLESAGFRSAGTHNVFLEADAGGRTAKGGAVRERQWASGKVLIASDLIPQTSPLLALYRWPPLRRLVAAAFDLEELHCPEHGLSGVYYNVFSGREEDALGWHFDNTPFSVNLILAETAPHGGQFQYL